MLNKKRSEDVPESMEILERDVLTRNDRKTLVQVALAGQPIDSQMLKQNLDSGLWWYREDQKTVVKPMPTLGKSELTASPESKPAITGNPVGDISLNEFMKLPENKQKEIVSQLQKVEEKQSPDKTNGSDEDDKKSSGSEETEETETGNPYLNRLNNLKDQYETRADLEKYAKSIGIADPSNKVYKNIGLLSEAIVRKENNLPDDFSFGETEE